MLSPASSAVSTAGGWPDEADPLGVSRCGKQPMAGFAKRLSAAEQENVLAYVEGPLCTGGSRRAPRAPGPWASGPSASVLADLAKGRSWTFRGRPCSGPMTPGPK